MVDMDEEFVKQKVLYLLMHGWNSLIAIQEHLELSDENMGAILQWLVDEQYIITHTIH
jgi:predicted transcriptional regulator